MRVCVCVCVYVCVCVCVVLGERTSMPLMVSLSNSFSSDTT